MFNRIPKKSLWILLASLCLMWVATFPYSIGILVGDSMEPTISDCSIAVYTDSVNSEQLEKGDIIRFTSANTSETYTHRVVGQFNATATA